MAVTAQPEASIAGSALLPVPGLTEGNDIGIRTGRSYWDIVRSNLFNLFNNILFALGVALIALGRYNDALTSVGLGDIRAY